MAVEVKPGAVIDKGGNKLVLLEVATFSGTTVTLATPTAGTYLFDVGYLANSDVNQTTTKTSFEAEDGDNVISTYTYQRMTSGVLMQSDADLINFLADTVKNKKYLEVKYTGYINALHQWHFKIVEVTPQFSVKRPGGANSMNYESTGVKTNTSVVISAATLGSISSALTLSNFPTTTVTITTAKQYAIAEV